MASLNDSFIIARSGILTHQTRMAVISHNIANVQTPGYHRQRAILGTNPPEQPNIYTAPKHEIGTGVRILDIVRSFDETQERQYLNLNSSAATQSLLSDTLAGTEALVNSTVDGVSLTDYLSKFWAAWQDVATNPSNLTMRSVLLEDSATLTYALNSVSTNLDNYSAVLLNGSGPYTGVIPTTVDDINSLATRIKDLNTRITLAEAQQSNANDLLDQRTSLIRDLSAKVGITLDADYTVRINGRILVAGDGSARYDLAIDTGSPLQFTLAGNPVTISGGELDGYIQTVDIVATLRSNLDTFASELISQVNALHTAGYDLAGTRGVEFFSGTGAGDVQVGTDLYDYSNPLLSHPELVAAASALDPGPPPGPQVGDGSNALRIADLAIARPGNLGNRTFAGYFTDVTASLGARQASAANLAEDNQTALDALENTMQSTDGVNQDEELLDMMSAQRAFEASARVATTVDEMMDTIINRMA